METFCQPSNNDVRVAVAQTLGWLVQHTPVELPEGKVCRLLHFPYLILNNFGEGLKSVIQIPRQFSWAVADSNCEQVVLELSLMEKSCWKAFAQAVPFPPVLGILLEGGEGRLVLQKNSTKFLQRVCFAWE